MLQLKLSLFGSFQLLKEEKLITQFRSNKTRVLLAYLVLEGYEPLPKQHLCTLLWEGYTRPAAQASLRTALTNLRQILKPAAQIQTTHHTIQFVPSAAFWCDASAFEADVSQARSNGEKTSQQRLAAPYRRQFMLGFDQIDSQPFLQWRERRQLRYQERQEQRQISHQLVGSRPVRDEAVIETQEQKSWQQALPRALTPLIGRAAEVQSIVAKIIDPEYPLLVLVGEGGVGKTRLALACAQAIKLDHHQRFADGLWFVTLSGISPGQEPSEQLAEAIGQVLQLAFVSDKTLTAQLLTHLQQHSLLLILDNFESWVACSPFLVERKAANGMYFNHFYANYRVN